jgi:uncharacterized protein DUF3455
VKHFQTPTPQSTWRRRWTTSLMALTAACLALLPQGLYAYDSLASPVPAVLKVPGGHKPLLLSYATGTQNYICLHSDSGFAWVFFGPQATLFDDNKTQILTHFLSPNRNPRPEEQGMARATWQDSQDTSTVWAKMIASSDAPAVVQPGAIPWLLLKVVGADRGPTGGDRLTETTYIQRVHTSGGLAPTTGCVQSSDVGTRALVPYTADYIFYKDTRRE